MSSDATFSGDGAGEAGPIVLQRGWTRRRTSYEIIDYIMTQIYIGELKPGIGSMSKVSPLPST